MKKSVYLTACLITAPLLSMYSDSSSEDLTKSRFSPPETKTRGLGFWRSGKDWIANPEDNLITDLETGIFDPTNESYPRKLQSVVATLIAKEETEKTIRLLNLLYENYYHKVTVESTQAIPCHKFLGKKNKEKQGILKQELTDKDKATLSQCNQALKDLQTDIEGHVQKIKNILKTHIEERDKKITEDCEKIRAIKQSLVILHQINDSFVLPYEEHCSEEEEQKPKDVLDFYSNEIILQYIQQDKKIKETEQKFTQLLENLTEINGQIQKINHLHYQ